MRLTADVTYTRMEQNEKLLAYSINSSMTYTAGALTKRADDPANLPSETAQTVMNLWVQDYQLANRFDTVSFGVKARSEQSETTRKKLPLRGTLFSIKSGIPHQRKRPVFPTGSTF